MTFLGGLLLLGVASFVAYIAYSFMQNADKIQKDLNPEYIPDPVVPEPVVQQVEPTPEPAPVVEEPAVPEQTRNALGQFVADDPATPDVNEAWIGGVPPKPKTTKKPKAKKAADSTEPKKKTQRKPKVKVVK